MMASDLVRITLARFVHHSTMPPWPVGDFEHVTMLPSLGKVVILGMFKFFRTPRKMHQDIQNGLGVTQKDKHAVFETLEHDQCFTSWVTPVSEASLRTPVFHGI